MGHLIRDNKILLKKLVNSNKNNFKYAYMRCDLNHCRVGVALGLYRITYLPVFKVDSDAIVFIEDNKDIYVCVDLDKVCTENNLRLCGSVSDSKNINGYMRLDEGFTKAVQFIKDNSLQDAYFNYIRTFMRDKFSMAVQNLLRGDKTFNLTKDAYFKNNKIAFARINFKDMIMYVYNGEYFDKVTLSSKSSHVDIYDISDIITITDSTGRLLFDGISCLFPNLLGDSVIS